MSAESPAHECRTDLRDLKDLAMEVIQIQDACNLRGLALGWHKSACRLAELVGYGPQSDRHPINQLWCHKLGDLCGVMTDDYSAAYAACRKLAVLEDARI